jgi:hypothetical protein
MAFFFMPVGKQAFGGCADLAGILLPETLAAIGGHAFSGCKSLAAITLPDSLAAIGDWAFEDCKNHCQQVKVRNQPVGRQGLVAILLRKIAARPCVLDCSGNPASPAGAEELQRKARFLARERQKGAHLFLNLLTLLMLFFN